MNSRRKLFRKFAIFLPLIALAILSISCGKKNVLSTTPQSSLSEYDAAPGELQVTEASVDVGSEPVVEDEGGDPGQTISSDETGAVDDLEDTGTDEPDLSHVFDEGSQFRYRDRLEEHYQKHVIDQQEFGDITIEEYLYLAQCLVDRPGDRVLTKVKDGDTYYYDPDTNSFAVVSDKGYIRTFFKPSAGKAYYDKQ